MQTIVIGALLAAGIVVLLIKAGVIPLEAIKALTKPYAPKALLTPNEREFFGRLCRALPEFHVFTQVAMSAIVDTARMAPASVRTSARNRFDRKVIDYVVVRRPSFEVVAIIELDDRTHDSERDAARDKITSAAGYRTVRFHSRRKPDVSEIRHELGLAAAPLVHQNDPHLSAAHH